MHYSQGSGHWTVGLAIRLRGDAWQDISVGPGN